MVIWNEISQSKVENIVIILPHSGLALISLGNEE